MYCREFAASVDNFQIGGKAANLARAASLGIRIPDGFIVTRKALTDFLGGNNLPVSVKELLERNWETTNDQQQQHATQIARECGIPFVNLPEEEWKNIPDHARISIDSEAGLVTILE